MPQKTCKKCKVKKDLSLFYVHKQMADGHLNFCKACVKKRVKKFYLSNTEKIKQYELERSKLTKRKKQQYLYTQRKRLHYPGKYRCHNIVATAIKDGRLIKMPCSVCGNVKSEAHHPDYRSPLKVVWLCLKHHRELNSNRE